MPILFRRRIAVNELPAPSIPLEQTGREGVDQKKILSEKIVLRRSIFFIIFSFISIELFFDGIYALLRIPPLYFHFPMFIQSELTPWYFLLFILLTVLKLLYMLLACVAWICSSYEIRKGEITYRYGILSKKKKIYLCSLAQEVVYRQGLMGRICNFGSIEVYHPAIKDKIILDSIPNPSKYTEIIKRNLPESGVSGYIAI